MDRIDRTLDLLEDRMSEPTRSARTSLLVSSVTGIVIVRADLVPTEIRALGIQLGQVDQATLLGILGLIILYFLVLFGAHATSELAARVVRRRRGVVQRKRESVPRVSLTLDIEDLPRGVDSVDFSDDVRAVHRSSRVGRWIATFRHLLDYILPQLVALTSLVLILTRIF